MSWNQDRKLRQYQKVLRSLKRPESELCSCPDHLHPRPWVHAPGLTSRPQNEKSLSWHRRSISNPELRMRSTSQAKDEDIEQQQQETLQHLYNEARVLQSSRSEMGSQNQEDGTAKQITELDKSLAEAVQQEEALQEELTNLREMVQNRQAFEEENKKLKKKIRHLQHRIKRQEEAKRVSRESLPEREIGTREEYVLLSLKKKYEDLLQYVLKVESENQKLKSLTGISGDGDDFINDYDRENNEFEGRAAARLQGELNILRKELLKKDHHIMECNERLQAMDALKEENLALHKSLRNKYEPAEPDSPSNRIDPRDISKALEDEWMGRLYETREMYEKAIEGYRSQLQEMQDKYDTSEAKHVNHVEELIENINELKNKIKNIERNYTRVVDGNTSKRDNDIHEVGDSSTVSNIFVTSPLSPQGTLLGLVPKSTDHQTSEQGMPSGREGRLPDSRIPEVTNPNNDVFNKPVDSNIPTVNPSIRQISINDENYESEDSSGVPVINRLQQNSRDKQEDIQIRYKDSKSERKLIHKYTQTAKYFDKDETKYYSSDNIKDPQEEMQESKEYLQKVNELVKKLEGMKLNGDGAEAILAVIRDTINECLHDWRESFQQQKALQKDSADELNKGYVELQRKLRSKSKQLESKHKQCKHLEEANTKLTEKCNRLEIKIASCKSSDQLEMLQDLPETLRHTEEKLIKFQEALQRAQEEKSNLDDQVKYLNEKLSKRENKIVNHQGDILLKENEIKSLNETVASLRQQLTDISKDVAILKEQLTTKDTILEHTSDQLEERIRECASLSAQIERQKLEMNQETRNTKVQLNENESASYKQLMDAQTLAAKYQAQLSSLRSEKEHIEKSLRHNIRRLEEQMDQLQLRNSTLQRQLTTITSTYHNMFTSVDLNNPLVSSPVMGSSSGK